MDGGVLFQGCRLEVGGLLGGPRGGGMVHGRCSVKLVLGTEDVIPCHHKKLISAGLSTPLHQGFKLCCH